MQSQLRLERYLDPVECINSPPHFETMDVAQRKWFYLMALVRVFAVTVII